jgi:predicted RNA-binding protein associated with RNAse of E/G family
VNGELEIVVKRSIHRGRIWSALPQLVLADEDDEVVALTVPGTTCRAPRYQHDMQQARDAFAKGRWELESFTWDRFVAVSRHRSDRYFNVTHLFDPTSGEFLCWYVNFERPLVRHDDGLVIDTLSLWLDLIVLPGGKTFWKDTDHWNWACEHRLFPDAEIQQVERVREELVDAVAAGVGPFDGTWTEWAPIELEPLALPEYWDRPTL